MPTPLQRLVRAGVTLAVVALCWAWALSLIYGSPFARVWQGVAALAHRAALPRGRRRGDRELVP